MASHLGFTSQRLLSYQRIRAGRAGMSLILNHMVKFENIAYPNYRGFFVRLSGTTINKSSLTTDGKVGGTHLVGDLVLGNFFKYGDSDFVTKDTFSPT